MIGPFRILKVLGEGGMGTVYLAEQEDLGRRVAVKLIRSPLVDRDAILRFAAERKALAKMHHPYIAQVFDAGTTDDGDPYIAMEYIPGLPLSRFCERRQLDLVDLLRLFITVAQGIRHAHDKGTIHRDIKPSNILVMDADRPIPKIIDFGIAKASDRSAPLTAVGAVVGTVAYMSPEQIRSGEIDHRTDIYSYGVMLHEILTGQLPDVAPATDAELWESYPSALQRIVLHCLEPVPSERYPDMDELIDDLGALIDDMRAAGRAGIVIGDEKLGERLMGELWKLFEAADEPPVGEVLELFERAIDAPAILRALVQEARRQEERRRRAHAVEERLVDAVADCRVALALPAAKKDRLEMLGRASDTLRRVIADGTLENSGVSTLLGDVLMEMDDLEEATRAYREAYELDQKNVRAVHGLARSLWPFNDRLEEALTLSWRAEELAPDVPAVQNNLGLVLYLSAFEPSISLFGRDKLGEALQACDRALILDPKLVAARLNLGLVLYRRGDQPRAVEAFFKVIDLASHSEAAKQLKYLLHEASGESLRRAVGDGSLAPVDLPFPDDGADDPDVVKGREHARRGRLAKAREAFANFERRRRDE